MARRISINRTGISRLQDVKSNDIWVSYTCVNCGRINQINLGQELLNGKMLSETAEWECPHCGYIHAITSDLPDTWENWDEELRSADSLACYRFWTNFFNIAVENKEAYWKQCKTCGRILPASHFSFHAKWSRLEKQLECRCCKASINAVGNPKRTTEQHREATAKRRLGDLLAKLADGVDEKLDIDDIFERFDSKCFKTGIPLDKADTSSWHIDHILPSKYFYPLTKENACLLSKSANENKKARWASDFYSPQELVRLSEITGANLALLSSPVPIYNTNIDVNAAVEKYLNVRNNTDLAKRISEVKRFIEDNDLIDKLSDGNKSRLGF
jgi:DNA-directed RNA polymerase subunit RPC12/RpoP